MGFVEKINAEGLVSGARGLVGDMTLLKEMQDQPGIRKAINSELWHACAGPLVSLPQVGSLVYYFPQGHSEQVAASTKQAATSQIPNYPNLPSQLMCQVHSITMHADKDTDEVYAQACLQPVVSENDVVPVPDFVLRPNKHPTEFFCKTLTASDTSTHGGFSVPRRAAEKLFPSLDYTMQPPTQELVVIDLHNNTWTFRHIYRGQPKRHLLTTGWSMFVGAKRLKAGDAVIFIRDERSQLLLGVRRTNRQQTTLPCSVISADSMHIGVLAAASHAAANRSPFTIFYNPRACPSEFVVPVSKYQKYVFGTQLSIGGRFGMMFETEDSSKRRYMGTIVGISDLDQLRWPGSKWRCLQVEWDDPGCGDRQSRVSPWEIETPESLFIFPSITSALKRPLHSNVFTGAENEWGNLINKRPFTRIPGNEYNTSTPNLCSEQLLNFLTKSQTPNHCEAVSSFPHENRSQLLEVNKNPLPLQSQSTTIQFQSRQWSAQSDALKSVLKVEEPLESSIQLPHPIDVSQLDPVNPSLLLPSDVWNFSSDFQFLPSPPIIPEISNDNVILPSAASHEMWDFRTQFPPQNPCASFNSMANSCEIRDFSDETNQSGTYYSMDPSSVLNDFGNLKDSSFQNPSDCLAGNFSSSQEARSQMTSASLPDSQAFCRQDLADTSGVTSSSNVDFHERSLLQNDSWKQVSPPMRTYTKVQKAGSVGRSIDVSVFMNYDELCCAIERMFGLEGLLNDPRNSGWKLVYVDYENDVLLVGDDPWEVFVRCVRCIRILSPSEVQQMSEEGMQLLNNMQAALP